MFIVIVIIGLLLNSVGISAMDDVIFREYDIRGKVGTELHVDQIYDLSRALANYFVDKNRHTRRVVVGMDVRTHSPAIKQEMCRGLIDSGLDVIDVGKCTSPMLYFATHILDVDAGLMITASHNPKEYNGIKICLGTEAVWGEEVQVIKSLYQNKKYIKTDYKGAITFYDIKSDYIDWLYAQFGHLVGIDLPMVIDCGNGAASLVIPDIIKKMQWHNAHLLCATPDGTFPNHEADPTVEKNMREVRDALKTYDANVGIGFDGDADRMGAMTDKGALVSGDKMLAVFAHHIIQTIPKLGVVYDMNASGGLKELVLQWGGCPLMSPCGHSIIKERMVESGALLGGEISCHFFFKDRSFGFDDGIYAAFRLLEILHETQKSLTELVSVFPKKISSPQYRLPCKEDEKRHIISAVQAYFKAKPDAEILTLDGVHVTMPYGWVLVRASNTQSVICFRFESDTQEDSNRIKQDVITALDGMYDYDLRNAFSV